MAEKEEMNKIIKDLKKKMAELDKLSKEIKKEKNNSPKNTKKLLEEIIVPSLDLLK